jgi:hypothetical protein
VIHHVLRVILYAIVTASVLAGPSLATPAKEAPWLPEAAAYRLSPDAVSGQSRAGPVGQSGTSLDRALSRIGVSSRSP